MEKYYSSKGHSHFLLYSIFVMGSKLESLGSVGGQKEANRGKRNLSFSPKGIMGDKWEYIGST
jgi:hypothetical protein